MLSSTEPELLAGKEFKPKISASAEQFTYVVIPLNAELTRGYPHRFLSLVRAILVSRMIVLTNAWVRRFCHQVPSGQYLIPIRVGFGPVLTETTRKSFWVAFIVEKRAERRLKDFFECFDGIYML